MPDAIESTDVELRTLEADGRGRICLGCEYADRTVTVAVLEPTGLAAPAEKAATKDSIDDAWNGGD
ncbi:MAG: hypothetical protein ABEJ86_06245 [Halococcoides sp.]